MKALEILKAFSDRHESAYGFNNIFVASLGDIAEALEELNSIEQRIAELSLQLSDAINIGVKQSFDIVKMVQANTDDERKADILDDIADLIIEEAHEYKVKWKSIVELSTPKTCDGCVHIDYRYGNDCFGCYRMGFKDRYEPKEQK